MTMLDRTIGTAVDEQPGGVAWLDRMLGDGRFGQGIIEIGRTHGRASYGSRPFHASSWAVR